MNCMRNKFKIVLTVFAALFALAAVNVYASGGGGEYDSLSPAKLKDLGWRVMNFAVLLFMLIYFLRKPIVNGLNNRRMGIVNQFEELNARRSEVEETYKEYEQKLGRIDQEVQSILDAAKTQAEAEKNKIIEDASRAAEDIKRKAELSIQYELSEAKKKLREEVAEQAAAMAAGLIQKNFTAADQNNLVEDYLDKVGTLQ